MRFPLYKCCLCLYKERASPNTLIYCYYYCYYFFAVLLLFFSLFSFFCFCLAFSLFAFNTQLNNAAREAGTQKIKSERKRNGSTATKATNIAKCRSKVGLFCASFMLLPPLMLLLLFVVVVVVRGETNQHYAYAAWSPIRRVLWLLRVVLANKVRVKLATRRRCIL